jgi:hypothetical protein
MRRADGCRAVATAGEGKRNSGPLSAGVTARFFDSTSGRLERHEQWSSDSQLLAPRIVRSADCDAPVEGLPTLIAMELWLFEMFDCDD